MLSIDPCGGVMKAIILILIFLGTNLYAQENENLSSCERAIVSTERVCLGTKIISQVAVLISAVKLNKATGNIREACIAASQISRLSASGNLAYATACGNLVRLCRRTCLGDRQALICEEYEERANLAKIQGIVSTINLAKSTACAEAVSGRCIGNMAYMDAACPEFCLNPNNKHRSQCSVNQHLANISNELPGQASEEVARLALNDSNSLYDFEGTDSLVAIKKAKVSEQTNRGLTFSPGSDSSFAIDDEKTQVSGERIEKEILKPMGSAVVTIKSVGGSSERSKNERTVSSDESFDLRDFLPNGKKSPTRNISNIKYSDASITPANGLSNFQKVTRKLNEKRDELLP